MNCFMDHDSRPLLYILIVFFLFSLEDGDQSMEAGFLLRTDCQSILFISMYYTVKNPLSVVNQLRAPIQQYPSPKIYS